MSKASDSATSGLTHTDSTGSARMVDVSAKLESRRVATAGGTIRMSRDAFAAIRDNTIAKGDVLGVARIAGVMAAKRTSDLIPLCHPIALASVDVALTLDESVPAIRAEATAVATGPTGVEMEAIVAVTIALTTIYDMAKSVDRGMVIGEVRLLRKSGGKSGDYSADGRE
ncbi:MAG TPA: cyclic pyranopterin monophosphate synthase MoaC [Gemmatimonadaceae bacterium]